ncbi:MAG: hypothetical protein LBH28_01855, partial [Oscillospiraceae bacterium]|nr:hypothetical protein [Oscillospiraceae bacterium]
QLSKLTVEQIVDTTFESYNDFISDLFMCVTFGADACKKPGEDGSINELGYLFLRAVNTLKAAGRTSYGKPDVTDLRRMRMAVAALTQGHGDGEFAIGRHRLERFLGVKLNWLRIQLNKRIDSQLVDTPECDHRDSIKEALNNDFISLTNRILDECCPKNKETGEPNFADLNRGRQTFIMQASDAYHCLFDFLPTLDACFSDADKRKSLLKLADEFYRTLYFVTLVYCINEAEAAEPLDYEKDMPEFDKVPSNWNVTKHMQFLYNRLTTIQDGNLPIRKAWSDLLNNPPFGDVREVCGYIADYYNGELADFRPRAMLYDAIQFIMCMYQYNHTRVIEEYRKNAPGRT